MKLFYFRPLSFFFFFSKTGAIVSVDRKKGYPPGKEEGKRIVPAEPRLTRQKRHNHRVPLRSFRLLRGDQLDRIGFRRFSLADLIEIAPKGQGKVGPRLLPRFGGWPRTEPFLQALRRIAEFFAR